MSPSKKVTKKEKISRLKEMPPPKKVTKKEKLLKGKLLPKLALIGVLKKCPKDARGQIISYLNSEGIKVLSETIHNVLRIEAPLKDYQKKRLRKEYGEEKEVLLEIAQKRGSFKNKRKLLKQSGGFLGTLLGIYKKRHVLKESDFNTRYLFTGIATSLLMPLIFGHK